MSQSRSPTPPQLRAVLAATLWLAGCRGTIFEAHRPGCDDGKLHLRRDLPEDVRPDCPAWRPPAAKHPAINKVYYPEPARQVCMDRSIAYKQAIPSSGAYRPVMAESGEYVYCPPQRWLNNLHHAATVLLHHPCAPPRERLFLSALARSCLQRYILTSHLQLKQHTPVALVSWGRTLELSTAASPDVCHWLETTTSAGETSAGASGSGKYNLLLTRSAEKRGPHQGDGAPNDIWAHPQETAGLCCERILSSFLEKKRDIRAALAEEQSRGQASNRQAPPGSERTGSEPPGSAIPPGNRSCDSCRDPTDPLAKKGYPGTDEAVWAAAALGSLLVLLALAVLHTRLYRHWRSAPSLYWYDPRRDYESVADVIHRRLCIAKKRRRRSRGQQRVLLPDASSSDEI